VSDYTDSHRSATRARQGAAGRAGMAIPDTLLLAVCAFGDELPARRVADALAKGVVAAGMPTPEACPIEDGPPAGFDERMRRARAVVVGAERLDRETLAGSAVFEIATRARQAGVPAYAVTGANELDAFDARMLDLQLILPARTPRGLAAAGTRLARLA
jgi:Glycerate kinase family